MAASREIARDQYVALCLSLGRGFFGLSENNEEKREGDIRGDERTFPRSKEAVFSRSPSCRKVTYVVLSERERISFASKA
jgi:hypothetical protein